MAADFRAVVYKKRHEFLKPKEKRMKWFKPQVL